MKKLNDYADGAMIGMVVALMVAIAIGVLIFYKLNQAVVTAGGTSDAIGDIFNSTNSTALTVWTLLPIVGIVVIAGVVLAIVMGFGRSQM
jgi:hypothetical protein